MPGIGREHEYIEATCLLGIATKSSLETDVEFAKYFASHQVSEGEKNCEEKMIKIFRDAEREVLLA